MARLCQDPNRQIAKTTESSGSHEWVCGSVWRRTSILHNAGLLGILNVITKSRLSFLILITAPKMPNLSLIPLKPSCHPQHDMRDAVFKYAIAHLNK